jgi:hypothetical protein
MLKKKRATPLQLISYQGADHGFYENAQTRDVAGYTDTHGKVHMWHLSYNPAAEKDMMQTIISAIKTKRFVKGVDVRPTGAKVEAKAAPLTPAELWKLQQN